MKKRLIAILMALTLVLTYMPAMAFADAAEEINASEFELVQDEPRNEEVDSYYGVYGSNVWYELNTYDDADQAGVWDYAANVSGTITIVPQITLSNGKTYTVTQIGATPPDSVTAITIPPTVVNISKWLGKTEDAAGNVVNIPGFTIFGKTGSYAQTFAAMNGLIFRDPEAEAEAARQGTPDGSIAKVKASKPKAAKTAVTVKWKKLNKKQLKKGKSTHYEVWLCPNKAFGAADTKMKVVGKGKSSAKIGGLSKKTTYFVKVRAIKYVGGVKMVGKWSAVKKVKTKK